jgi:glycosyltransferase 2 family protein
VDHAFLPSTQLTMAPAFRRTLHLAGSGLALLGIAFVVIRLNKYWGSRDLSHITSVGWVAIGGLAVLYGSANLVLALAWRRLLAQCDVFVTRMWAIRAYGVSQLAKYVPGNIFHIAGRQAIGMSAGISAGALAKSSAWELGLMAVAGMSYGWVVLPLLVAGLPSLASFALLLGTAWVVAHFLRRFLGFHASASFGLHVLFLAVSGGVFVILSALIVHGGEQHLKIWLFVGGSYVVAWLAGLVTPGAPAGLGVRELILLFLLNGLVADADLTMAVLLGRMVTVVGDLLFFGAAFFIRADKVFVESTYE